MADLDKKQLKMVLKIQRNELTEAYIYRRVAGFVKDEKNSKLLRRIGEEEKKHSLLWKNISGRDVKPNKGRIFFYTFITRLLGISFGVKLLERGESVAQKVYTELGEVYEQALRIAEEEQEHERALIDLIEEEHLKYVGSIVLGLNDALVELTGTLAGLTLAMRNTRLIALSGLITGIAASFSMAGSEYLSKRNEGEGEDALKSSLYTGVAYIVTVFLLIIPYLLWDNYMGDLAITLSTAILIIFCFNYYISIAKDLSFKRRFTEMAGISVGVALLSFGIGWVVRHFLGVDI